MLKMNTSMLGLQFNGRLLAEDIMPKFNPYHFETKNNNNIWIHKMQNLPHTG